MQMVDSSAIDRQNLLCIFFFRGPDAPEHMNAFDSWFVAAKAVGKNAGGLRDMNPNDWKNNEFLGFNTLAGARAATVATQISAEMLSWIEQWAAAKAVDISKARLHYTTFDDPKYNCTWGLAYLML